jgi:hypothetical protein
MSPPHDFQTTPTLSMYEGRLGYRTRPRRLVILLLAATFIVIVLFSRHHFPPAEPAQSLGAPHAGPLAQYPPVEPVVFALIMYSEGSATEGAILLKVLL